MAGKTFGLAGLEALARQAGVDRIIVMPNQDVRPKNQALAEAIAAYTGNRAMFRGCAWLNPHFGEEAVAELETAVREWGFCGLKLMATHHAFRFVTSVPHALVHKAQALGVPVTVHTGASGFSHPLEVAELASAFPGVPFILDHMGYRYLVPEAIAAARRAPNIYLATTAVMEPHFIRLAVQELGAERLVFGSNAPMVYPATQLLVIKQAELSEADERKILSENIAHLHHWD